MKFPLILLAIGAAFAGFIPFGNFVSSDGNPLHTGIHVQFSILPVVLGLAGILGAFWLYKKENERPAKLAAAMGGLYKAAYRKFFIDEIYLFITKKILFNLVGRPAAWFDRNIVDGLMNLTGNTTEALAAGIKKLQSGKVQQYALFFLAGVIGLAVLFIYVWR